MITKIKIIAATTALAAMMTLGAQSASATTISLNDIGQCSNGTATNGIAIGDVTGNNGGATDCWGTLDNNDPGPNGAFTYDGMTFSFISKIESEGIENAENTDIGLDLDGTLGNISGTWAFDGLPSGYGDFLIVLKAANSPGYAVWGFFGDPDNTSTSGTWNVAWGKDLSHLTVYAAPSVIPLPAAGWLLLMGIGGLGVASRRRRKAQHS